MPALAEAGSLDGHRRERAPDLVHDQSGQCLALDVLGQHHNSLAGLHDLLQNRQEVLHGGDLLIRDQDVCILEHGFLTIGVRDEVRRDVALIELHSLGELQLHAECLAVLDGDDTLVADLLESLRDVVTDRVVGSRIGSHIRNLVFGLTVDGSRHFLDGLDHLFDSPFDPQLHLHRIGTGSDKPEPVGHHGLCQHRRRGRAVTCDVIGLVWRPPWRAEHPCSPTGPPAQFPWRSSRRRW